MTQYGVEPDELAAFLDGRLSDQDRAEVIKKLAESPESYELLIETVEDLYPETHQEHVAEWERDERLIDQALGKLGDAEGETDLDVIPIWERAWRHTSRFAPRYAAAAAAAVVALVLIDIPSVGPTGWELADRINASSLPGGWEQPPWSVLRGTGSRMTDEQRSFRLGVRATDARIAFLASDRSSADSFLDEQITMLRDVVLSEGSRARLTGLRSTWFESELSDVTEQFDQIMESVSDLGPVASDRLRAGQVVEAARLASISGTTAFFESRDLRNAFEDAGRLGIPPDEQETLDAIAGILRDGVTAIELDELQEILNGLISRYSG